jgi:nucleoside 2-deoxyribosyltransferase
MSAKVIYLASPLGFSPENGAYLKKVKRRLVGLGFEVFDPWEQKGFEEVLQDAFARDSYLERVVAFRKLASDIGAGNERGIAQADIVLAILDGAEVDSGTASEVGFGSALGKRCYGLRTDVRDSGDFVGIQINLQVLHFIERTGGVLFRSIEEIVIP